VNWTATVRPTRLVPATFGAVTSFSANPPEKAASRRPSAEVIERSARV
jgi:hypothetical protein